MGITLLTGSAGLRGYAAEMEQEPSAAEFDLFLEKELSLEKNTEEKGFDLISGSADVKSVTALEMLKEMAVGKKAAQEQQDMEAEILKEQDIQEEILEEQEVWGKAAKEQEVKQEVTEEKDGMDGRKLVIADVSDYVNIRSLPGKEGAVIGKLYDGSVGTFIEETKGWIKIESGSCIGYVKAEYCIICREGEPEAREAGRRIAVVTAGTLNVRKEANTGSVILSRKSRNEKLIAVQETDGWIKIETEEGYGYVSDEYVTLSTEFVEAESVEEEKERLGKEEERQAALQKEEEIAVKEEQEEISKAMGNSSENSDLGQQVADFAVQFVGNPYSYGGTSLTNGADCSGFTLAVYSNFGVSLPHSAAAQNKKGTSVGSIENAMPGDIVYYSGHVGIYIGNGQIVHAGNSKTGILISDANYDRILGVRRIF